MLVSAPEEVEEEEERQDSGTGEEEQDSGRREKEEDSGMGEEGEEGTAPENGRNEKLGEYRCSCTLVSSHFGREKRV